jgi:hypothetical protein
MRLLLWQFSKPVLYANLIAWPTAALIMHRWLQDLAAGLGIPRAARPTAVHCNKRIDVAPGARRRQRPALARRPRQTRCGAARRVASTSKCFLRIRAAAEYG